MRVSITQNGLTLRAIAGSTSVILGIDLQQSKRAGCLGFSIQRTDLGRKGGPAPDNPVARWLPNRVKFPDDNTRYAVGPDAPPDAPRLTTRTAPLQKFRWGDYTTEPGHIYLYRVYARYGDPRNVVAASADVAPADPFVEVTVTTEDPQNDPECSVFFNRGAAASQAYNDKFGQKDPEQLPNGLKKEAYQWLSRGLEEAIEAYIGRAVDNSWTVHAAIYEFQKPNLLGALKTACKNKANVEAVFHCRSKDGLTDQDGAAILDRIANGKATSEERKKDLTFAKNLAAIKAARLGEEPDKVALFPRRANPQDAISHNKFVVLLQNDRPVAVWTGSTNWTDGGIYGQLNVGHAVYDPTVAAVYEEYYQLLRRDAAADELKAELERLTPVPPAVPRAHGVWPILSPQSDLGMIHLYAEICQSARCLMVCAPFELHREILKALENVPDEALHYLLLDKEGSIGRRPKPRPGVPADTEPKAEVDVIEGDPHTSIAIAAPLESPLHTFQRGLLADTGPEHFHHPGIHIHSKIILADPFGSEPTLVTGSANFSTNSTTKNDSNSLIVRGELAVIDIYTTEFMRMFEHYHFRASRAKAEENAKSKGMKAPEPLQLHVDDSWSAPYYTKGSKEELDRRMFAGNSM